MIDYFKILQIEQTATTYQINEAYQSISRQLYLHDAYMMPLIDEAYNTLIDPESRSKYLKTLKKHQFATNSLNQKTSKNPYPTFKPIDLVGNFVSAFFISFLFVFILTAILVTALN